MRYLFIICVVAMSGCAQNGFREFYHPHFDRQNPPFPASTIRYLGENEKPQIFSSINLERDVKIARSKYWVPIGYSSFNGAMGTQDQLLSQATALGASMVLVNSYFTENRTTTVPMFVPNNKTTSYNGTSNGQIIGNSGYNANYNSTTTGTSTTYGTSVVPITNTQARFEQNAVFFVSQAVKKLKFGLALKSLSPEQRVKYERNTGAEVDIVFENSPAFNANILPGDVITEIAGNVVLNDVQAMALMRESPPSGLTAVKLIRNGAEKTISLLLEP